MKRKVCALMITLLILSLAGCGMPSSDPSASAVQMADSSVEQINNVVQANTAAAQESAASAEELSSQSIMLKETVARFKLREQ